MSMMKKYKFGQPGIYIIHKPPTAGDVTTVDVPWGFSWCFIENDKIEVTPGWWRKLKHKLTGKW